MHLDYRTTVFKDVTGTGQLQVTFDLVPLSLDYSQIKLRLLARIAGIDALKRAFHEGRDIHALTAAQMFEVDAGTVDPEWSRNVSAEVLVG